MKCVFYIAILFLITSCNQAKNPQETFAFGEDDIEKINPADDTNRQNPDSIEKEIILVDEDFYRSASRELSDTIKDYSYYKLDEFTRRKSGQTHFKYYIMRHLDFHRNYKSYLIAEDYESEMACWLVNYAPDNSLIDFREVYYDNAEGFRWIYSSIDVPADIVEITEGNIYSEPETTTVRLKINKDGVFVGEKES